VRINVLAASLDLDPQIELFDPSNQPVSLTPTSCSAPFTSICSFQAELAPTLSGTYTLLVSDAGTNNPAATSSA
jgi:hypothetical protein